jgi:HD-GYP domain-containing protein (c-di-GMP phosphodiesterase class II)
MLAAAALGAAVTGVLLWTGALGSLESSSVIARFALRPPQPTPREVTIVGIDDRTFSVLGARWPFRRSIHGRLLARLHAAGAKAVFYDVQFTEPTTRREDGALYRSLERNGGALLATTEVGPGGTTNVLGGDAHLARAHSRAVAAAFPVGAGGVISGFKARMAGLDTPAAVLARRFGRAVPASGGLIDYRGGPGAFPTLSFGDVVRGQFDPAQVRGKIVIVGATSPSLQDVHATPVAPHTLLSGAEVQANAIWTALHGEPLRPAPAALDALLIVLLALVGPLMRVWRGVLRAVIAGLLGAASYVVLCQAAFDHGLLLPATAPLAGALTAIIATVVVSHMLETRELRRTQLEIVERLGQAAESRDGETGDHLRRIGIMVERLALATGMTYDHARTLRLASALHDVGKIGVPDAVLHKPGRLDDEEWVLMRRHAQLGADILAGSKTRLIQMAEVVARTHHERWDGSGYPAGLRGEQIPLEGRICAICDVFDALVTARSYKPAWTLEAAMAELSAQAGRHFDPDLVPVFLRLAPDLYRRLVPVPPVTAQPPAGATDDLAAATA